MERAGGAAEPHAAREAARRQRQEEVIALARAAGVGLALRHDAFSWLARLEVYVAREDARDRTLPHGFPLHKEHHLSQQPRYWGSLCDRQPLLRYVVHGEGDPAAALAAQPATFAARRLRLATLLRSLAALRLAAPAEMLEALKRGLTQYAHSADDFAALMRVFVWRSAPGGGVTRGRGNRSADAPRWLLRLQDGPLRLRPDQFASDAAPAWARTADADAGDDGNGGDPDGDGDGDAGAPLIGFHVGDAVARFVFEGPEEAGASAAGWLLQHLCHATPGAPLTLPRAPWAPWSPHLHMYVCAPTFLAAVRMALHAPCFREMPPLPLLLIIKAASEPSWDAWSQDEDA
jgi:hypothetical protein